MGNLSVAPQEQVDLITAFNAARFQVEEKLQEQGKQQLQRLKQEEKNLLKGEVAAKGKEVAAKAGTSPTPTVSGLLLCLLIFMQCQMQENCQQEETGVEHLGLLNQQLTNVGQKLAGENSAYSQKTTYCGTDTILASIFTLGLMPLFCSMSCCTKQFDAGSTTWDGSFNKSGISHMEALCGDTSAPSGAQLQQMSNAQQQCSLEGTVLEQQESADMQTDVTAPTQMNSSISGMATQVNQTLAQAMSIKNNN